ncbi:Oidioi.mRNA.OKI2018_I69.PAR.g11289.t1.cds [Oikopleura dioica]|uniref:Oidioi.mRNA.OKI2018_I69.PAR.g11289.t1.cds n=1 Tax=Oikopleura dioica TaxID=34765 RepID=A0ABN7RYG0_OIKDI|nr:Oidioi.mRNA.OKI2018_I69.PAR.g11289.t1.cds [Oikopleura dioica]
MLANLNRGVGYQMRHLRLKKYNVSVKPSQKVTLKYLQSYDSEDSMMYGATRSDLLVLEKSFPNLYKEYINTDLVFDETKEAIIQYLKTGEVQKTTGAGLNPVDKFMARNINELSILLIALMIPICVVPFLVLREWFVEKQKVIMREIQKEMRELKREKALILSNMELNKATISMLESS